MGLDISIHAPRTGSDDTPPPSAPPASYFNPRSPHGERRFRPEPVAPTQDISIHAPRTGSDLPENAERITRRISIHAPRTGSDNPRRNHARQQIYFNPRSPHGERLISHPLQDVKRYFNPRSPHGERLPPTCARNLWRNFNPRSPHGERQDRAFLNRRIEISIHAPRTGSDDGRGRKKRSKNLISIHAPRTGSDVVS